MRIEVTQERFDWFGVLILDGNKILASVQGATTKSEALILAFTLAAKRLQCDSKMSTDET